MSAPFVRTRPWLCHDLPRGVEMLGCRRLLGRCGNLHLRHRVEVEGLCVVALHQHGPANNTSNKRGHVWLSDVRVVQGAGLKSTASKHDAEPRHRAARPAAAIGHVAEPAVRRTAARDRALGDVLVHRGEHDISGELGWMAMELVRAAAHRVPMYEVLKLLFILWLVMPQTNGAAFIFAHYLTPFLAAYERDIDKVVSTANGWSLDLVANILQAVANTLRAQLATLAGPVLQAAPAPVQGTPVPPSQHNPVQGVTSQAASALQASAPIVMGIGTAIANWIMAASQQASDAAHPEEPPAPSPQPRRSVSGPQTSPRPPQTEVLRTRRIFSPNPLDDPGRL